MMDNLTNSKKPKPGIHKTLTLICMTNVSHLPLASNNCLTETPVLPDESTK